jgi:hypothetical protein
MGAGEAGFAGSASVVRKRLGTAEGEAAFGEPDEDRERLAVPSAEAVAAGLLLSAAVTFSTAEVVATELPSPGGVEQSKSRTDK